MKKMYCVSTCSTCQRIIQETGVKEKGFIIQDIKHEKITPEQLDELKKLAGSYEALFSKRSLKYRAMGLHEKKLTEKDYRNLILQEYTFLKRPTAVVGNQIFIGSAKSTVEALKKAMRSDK
ncbi:MAG: arsenate reductase [Chitinophagaceae bacterium]|nr:arsenate reductase [Chitinophagaceae bacterium]